MHAIRLRVSLRRRKKFTCMARDHSRDSCLVVDALLPVGFMLAPFTIEILGLAAAMLTTLCWVPQAVRTIRTRDTRAISLITQCAFTAGVFLWLLYGLAIGSTPIILANAITFVLVTTILALKLRYG